LLWLCTRGDVGHIPEVHYLRRAHGKNLSRCKRDRDVEWRRIRMRYEAGQVNAELEQDACIVR
jgi:hypothetical protein